MLTIIIESIIIAILILLSAFFSSSETALTTISPHRLRTLVEEKYRHAATLEKILSDKEKMLSVILICNNIVNLAASALTTVLVQRAFGNWAVSIGTGILTVIILVFGEISPKTIATYRAEKLALAFSPVIFILMKVFTPIAAAVNFLSRGVLHLFHVSKDDRPESYTENEIRSIMEVSTEEGVIENKEKEIIENVFDFTDTIVREVMVPRVNVTCVSEDSGYEEVKQLFTDYMYTRLPVSDSSGNGYVGMLNSKDFIFLDSDDLPNFQVRRYMRPLPYTYEQKHLSELFLEMKKKKVSMMAVMDEYGVTAGIITMEDLLEEIVGDIQDEYDEEEEQFRRISPDEYEVPGSTSLLDINDRLGTSLSSVDYDSVGGLLMELLDRLPEEGDKAQADHVILTASKMEGPKIALVRLRLLPQEQKDLKAEDTR